MRAFGCIEERPNLEAVFIPAELETEEVVVPEEPCGFNDSSASHHLLVYREELVDTGVEKSSKPSEAVNALEGCISLDAGHLDSLDSSRGNEAKAGGDAILRNR